MRGSLAPTPIGPFKKACRKDHSESDRDFFGRAHYGWWQSGPLRWVEYGAR